jgi:hypothetical protein
MTLEEHAAAIEAAIKAAHADGFDLDDGDDTPIRTLELNQYEPGNGAVRWVSIDVPQ